MNSYLLLRNNRETGPYSLEDLLRAGLKPYDLVWVKDRSAAWRYPSEIEELKAYAPVVEEQPYDRFYKRPSDQEPVAQPALLQARAAASASPSYQQMTAVTDNTRVKPVTVPLQPVPSFPEPVHQLPEVMVTASAHAPVNVESVPSVVPAAVNSLPDYAAQPVLSDVQEKASPVMTSHDQVLSPYAPKPIDEPIPLKPARSVFVTMPSGARLPIKAAAPAPSPRNPVRETIATVPAATRQTVNDRAVPGAEPLSTRYSQPLDEIKERYVQTLNDRKQKVARDDWWKGIAKKAALVVGILGVGLLAGFMMRNPVADQPSAVNSIIPAAVVIPDSVVAEAEMNADSPAAAETDVPAPQQESQENNAENNTAVASVAGDGSYKNNNSDEVSKTRSARQQSVKENTTPEQTRRQVLFDENKFAKSNSIVNPETGERTKQSRQENVQTGATNSPQVTAVKTPTRNDWGGQVTVASNDYKKVAFGGIRNLQLTVTNHGKKELENVVVELTYLKPSEEPLRSEQIRFKNIEANSSSTIRIPDTNRGIKVTFKIVQVIGGGNEAVAGN